jgi:hypothetical protein
MRASTHVPVRISALAALFAFFVFTAAVPSAAKTRTGDAKTKDTVLSPGPDGITYEEDGGGHDAEKKVVAEDTAAWEKKAVAPAKARRADKHAHKGTTGKPVPTTVPKDSSVTDTTRLYGTPGSPTGAGSRGTPGEKPIPGDKK